jgi:hypothetical protein
MRDELRWSRALEKAADAPAPNPGSKRLTRPEIPFET